MGRGERSEQSSFRPESWRILLLSGALSLTCLALQPSADARSLRGAATIWVETTGTNDPGCGAELDPCATIQYAYDAASDGDTIRVMPGSYAECPDLQRITADPPVQRSIVLVADAFDPLDPSTSSLTTIDGTGVCPGQATVTLGGPASSIEGFTITGGTLSGLFTYGGATITHNVFTGNGGASGGGGIYLYPKACLYGSTTTIVSGNEITNNTTADDTGYVYSGLGGGIFVRAESQAFVAGDPIDGSGCVGGGPTITIDGNLISGNESEFDGGGMLVFTQTDAGFTADVTITQNTIQNNDAGGYGGGLYATTYGSGTERIRVLGNAMLLNTAAGYGGGLVASVTAYNVADHQVTVDGNTIQDNVAVVGGGAVAVLTLLDLEFDQPVVMSVTDNLVSGNVATSLDETGGGGGLSVQAYSRRSLASEVDFVVEGNTITDNAADLDGGGVEIYMVASDENLENPGDTVLAPADAPLLFSNNLVTFNSTFNGFADATGGGMLVYLAAFGESETTADLSLNTIAWNDAQVGAAGIEIESYTTGGLSTVNLSNSIVAGNVGSFGLGGPGPGNAGIFTPGSGGSPPDLGNLMVDVAYSDVFGHSVDYETWIGDRTGLQGNISADPLFLVPGVDYHVQLGSPAVDAGDPAPAGPLPATDLDGDPRLAECGGGAGARLDMGADELAGSDGDLDGYTECSGDCDDTDDTINPGEAEICGNGIDEDCDGADLVCPAAGQELIVDYEGGNGTWILYDGLSWSRLHTTSPDAIIPANTDGNATDEILVDFGGSTGVWIWDPVATPKWRKFYDSSPKAIIPANTDGNTTDELIFDFGPGEGVWFWRGDTTPRWKKFYDASPLAIVPADTDGDTRDELVVDISVSDGLWSWSDIATPRWRKFYDLSPVGVTPADLDGDSLDELVVNISAAAGTWIWDSTATPKWSKLYDGSAEELIRADIDGDGEDDLVANLGVGVGLWIWSDAATPKWRKIRGQIPESLIAADLDSDGKDELVADFGAGTGLRIYRDVGGGVWRWTTQAPPEGLGLDENSSPGALAVAELGSAGP